MPKTLTTIVGLGMLTGSLLFPRYEFFANDYKNVLEQEHEKRLVEYNKKSEEKLQRLKKEKELKQSGFYVKMLEMDYMMSLQKTFNETYNSVRQLNILEKNSEMFLEVVSKSTDKVVVQAFKDSWWPWSEDELVYNRKFDKEGMSSFSIKLKDIAKKEGKYKIKAFCFDEGEGTDFKQLNNLQEKFAVEIDYVKLKEP